MEVFYGTNYLVSYYCWRSSETTKALEENYSIEKLDKIQKAVTTMNANYLYLFSNKHYLLRLVDICLWDGNGN